MGDWVKEAAPACDSQLISPGTFQLPVHHAPCPILGRRAQHGGLGREGAGHCFCPHQAASGTRMEGIPFSTSGAPVPKQREEEQTTEAASRPDCLERRLDPQRAKEVRVASRWSQSWHCLPKWRHQAPAPARSLAPRFSPPRDPSQTLRSRLSADCHFPPSHT